VPVSIIQGAVGQLLREKPKPDNIRPSMSINWLNYNYFEFP
jgi:hypothetical protein